MAYPHRGVPAAPAVVQVRKAPNTRAGLAAGEDDACVLRRAARCWDAVDVVVGVACLLGSRLHQLVISIIDTWDPPRRRSMTHAEDSEREAVVTLD